MSVLHELRGLSRLRILQLLGLAGFLVWAGGRALALKYYILDLDLYWHLSVGNWILQHHSVPHAGILSYTAANRPWTAYSWGYEILLALVFRWFGLLGIAGFGVLLTAGVAVCSFWMLHRLSGRFWVALPVAALASWAFLFSLMPRPVFFSMIFFMVTLTLILEARRSGDVRRLYWLAPIFAVWANLHIQFVYGLFLLGLLLGINVVQRLAGGLAARLDFISEPALPLKQLAAVFTLCLLATCIGPYSFHLYQVILEYSQAKLSYAVIIEHYVQLLLTAAAFFVVGWQKKIDPYKLALLLIASVVSFRTMRDAWFICIVAAACIADCSFETLPETEAGRSASHTAAEMTGVAVVAIAFLLLIAQNTDFNLHGLYEVINGQFPVGAVNYLRQNPPPGPLYNNLDWGGFLTWYMPDYPVAIDGRNDLYGDNLDRRFVDTQMGAKSWETDPYLNRAGVVLLERNVPLANLLMSDPRFVLAYQDPIAVVFLRR
jgi:hypothetical protein